MKKEIVIDEKDFQISEKLQSVGLNLTLISTLADFLEYGISDNFNFSNKDIENLVIVMKKIIEITIKEQDEIEEKLDI